MSSILAMLDKKLDAEPDVVFYNVDCNLSGLVQAAVDCEVKRDTTCADDTEGQGIQPCTPSLSVELHDTCERRGDFQVCQVQGPNEMFRHRGREGRRICRWGAQPAKYYYNLNSSKGIGNNLRYGICCENMQGALRTTVLIAVVWRRRGVFRRLGGIGRTRQRTTHFSKVHLYLRLNMPHNGAI